MVVCKGVVVVVVDLGLISSTGQADLLQRFKSGKEINKMKKQFLEAEHTQRHANKQNLLVSKTIPH